MYKIIFILQIVVACSQPTAPPTTSSSRFPQTKSLVFDLLVLLITLAFIAMLISCMNIFRGRQIRTSEITEVPTENVEIMEEERDHVKIESYKTTKTEVAAICVPKDQLTSNTIKQGNKKARRGLEDADEFFRAAAKLHTVFKGILRANREKSKAWGKMIPIQKRERLSPWTSGQSLVEIEVV